MLLAVCAVHTIYVYDEEREKKNHSKRDTYRHVLGEYGWLGMSF